MIWELKAIYTRLNTCDKWAYYFGHCFRSHRSSNIRPLLIQIITMLYYIYGYCHKIYSTVFFKRWPKQYKATGLFQMIRLLRVAKLPLGNTKSWAACSTWFSIWKWGNWKFLARVQKSYGIDGSSVVIQKRK